jgi:FkbM family methyltransferase
MKLYNEKGQEINYKNIEHIEQRLAQKYIEPNDKVLELGARYGSVSIVTNKIINDKSSHYVVEPDSEVWNCLQKNMELNDCRFNIIKGIISNKKYSLTGSNYAKRSIENKNSNIKSYPLPNINFNVLIADCEGFLETFYDENPTLFQSLDKMILEFDEPRNCNYSRLKQEFFNLGFVIKEEINHYGLYHYVFTKPKLTPKMLFCSLSDRPELSQPMFNALQNYCNKWNYKCVLENKVLSTERAPSWSKIILLQRAMKENPNIETIVWIDDDILITNENKQFEDLIKDYPFNNILVSADVIWSPINCGILVCKNNQETYDYLDTIWELCEQYPEKKWNGLWEQDIMVIHAQMNSVLNPNEKIPLVIIPHNIIQSFHRDHTLKPPFIEITH